MTEYVDVIYSRVSKEDEKVQDLEIQEKKIIEKFGLVNPKILRERGSAYDLNKFHKREKFIKFIRYAFQSDKITIDDLFARNISNKKKIRLYVWDSHRIMRNIQMSLFFLLLSDFFDIQVFTFKDGKLNEDEKETPIRKLVRYMTFSIHAFSGEEYSYTTSENIKKSFVRKGEFTYSRRGNKVGKNFKTVDGKKINFPYDKLVKLQKRIKEIHKYYARKEEVSYYDRLIEIIKKEFGIIISKPYITKWRYPQSNIIPPTKVGGFSPQENH